MRKTPTALTPTPFVRSQAPYSIPFLAKIHSRLCNVPHSGGPLTLARAVCRSGGTVLGLRGGPVDERG